jgi:malonyl-CoA decarboxylase
LNASFLQELLSSIADRGRQLLPGSLGRTLPKEGIAELASALLTGRGEASGVAVAAEILARYRLLGESERRDFLAFLAQSMQPDPEGLASAARAYLADPDPATVGALQKALESPLQEFFRRLNLAPGATADLVALRRDLLAAKDPKLAHVDRDLMHLFASWFNRGFLVLRRIDWQTPAAILEKIIAYEAVHEIQGWDDLRRRLDPTDRRCFAFFHPSLIDEPLIFVEVALMSDIPDNIHSVLGEAAKACERVEKPSTAVFYSISNCQEGLRGISFGSFLIKQVVDDLMKERASLKTFVTLSPVPRFAEWVAHVLAEDGSPLVGPEARARLALLDEAEWIYTYGNEVIRPLIMRLAAHYFLHAKNRDGYPLDPVARFHLGNGARLERINWQGDVSPKGLREAHGLMCNYRYEPKDIERNHEAYENERVVAASRQVHALLRPERARPQGAKLLQLPSLRTAGLKTADAKTGRASPARAEQDPE